MAVSTGYVVRETAGNLRRNLLMTVAAIVTMAVSLTALGSVLVMREAINKASIQWRGGVELAIFLEPSIPANQSAAIGHQLADTPGVKTFHFVDKTQAYAEFKTIFGSDATIEQAVSAKDMPPSYRVVPTRARDVAQLGKQFQGQPGVLTVSDAQQVIASQLHRFNILHWIGIGLAVLVMVGAIVLIVSTIQLAIFSRRREVAVMKLVGATNWFIRVPFMLEGLVHGLVGAAIAFVLVYLSRETVANFIGNESLLSAQKLYVSSGEAIITGVIMLGVGVLVGALGSAFAVRRFLSV